MTTRLFNLVVLLAALFFCTALIFMGFAARDSFSDLSTELYGPSAPLMGSPLLDNAATPLTGALFVLVFLGLATKEFYIADLRKRLILNFAAFIALGAATVLTVYLFSAPALGAAAAGAKPPEQMESS